MRFKELGSVVESSWRLVTSDVPTYPYEADKI